MTTLCKSFLKANIVLCTILFLNANNVFALAPYNDANAKTIAGCKYWHAVYTCGICPDGTQPRGKGPITCETKATAIDFGLNLEVTSY